MGAGRGEIAPGGAARITAGFDIYRTYCVPDAKYVH